MPPVPRTRLPEPQAPPEPTVGASQAAGAAVAAGAVGTIAVTAGGAAGVAATVPPVGAAAQMLAALDVFFARQRAREDHWIVGQLQAVDGIQQQDILDVVADENARRAEFERKVRDRLRTDAAHAEVLPARERREKLRDILAREKRYAEQRTAAVAQRSLSLADRLVLRRVSPQGAFWRLGVAERHTPDCLAMAGKLWPWVVLDAFHPPTHTGCVCTLHGYAQAVANGWLRAGDVQDTAVALRRAAAARLLLHEEALMDMRAALVRAGVTTQEQFDRAALRAGGMA